jgi:hypothetical protein
LCFALRGERLAGLAALPLYLLSLHEILQQPLLHPTAGFARDLPGEAVLFTLMLALVILFARLRLVPERLDRLCGDLTDPVYVGHLLPIIVLASLGALGRPGPLWLLPSLVGTALIVLVVDRLVELPVAAVRARIRGTRLEGPAAAGNPLPPPAG